LPTGDRFMVMEFLDGEPLNSRIERLRQLTAEQATPLVLQALAGLSAAHQAGIIHRDLKPENLFVLKQKAGVPDFVKIIDFGISKFSQLNNEGMKMTKTGSVMGTPYYMSPEQANGSREADARSDLYAMGVILYECVTGAVPFDGKTFNELLFKIVLSDAPQPRLLAPNLDPAFEALIMKAMAREVTARFQTCEEFAQALRDWQAGRGIPMADVTGPVPAFNATAPAVSQPGPQPGPRGLSTGANWSNTGMAVPKRSNAPLVAALLGGALLIVGGGAFAAYKVMHGSAAAASPTPSASVEPKAELTAPPPPASEAPTAAKPIETAAEPPVAPSAKAEPSAKPLVAQKPNVVSHAPAHAPAVVVAPPKAPVITTPPKKKSGATDFGY